MRKTGVCALTQKDGIFVKSHILPKALTKPAIKGAPFLQTTRGEGYKKRFSSWYDKTLVIRQGEDVLEKLDDAAIKCLRKDMLIWSSWHFHTPFFRRFTPASLDHSTRCFVPSAPKLLHRFFVSVAWRACASRLPDMAEAVASEKHIELMRKSLLSKTDLSPSFFPVSLTQLTTKGEVHNLAPMSDTVKPPREIARHLPEESWQIIRIYFDGLIAHVHLNPDKGFASDNPNFLGSSDKLMMSGVTYEASFEYENLLINSLECFGPLSTRGKQETGKCGG